jgi:hypothetical protein
VPSKLKTPEKKATMTASQLEAYARAQKAVLFSLSGGRNPLFGLLDIQHLTKQCGEPCTRDGIHFVPEVYEAALQNVLRIAMWVPKMPDSKSC